MDKESHLNLNDQHKTKLLELGLTPPAPTSDVDQNETHSNCLYNIITAPLPIAQATTMSLPTPLQGLSHELISVAGRPLGDLIQDQTTPLSTFEHIKQYAKQKGHHADSDITQDAYMVVYFAAIAGALLVHQTKITQHTAQDLKRFFLNYRDTRWVLPELKQLFNKAEQAV